MAKNSRRGTAKILLCQLLAALDVSCPKRFAVDAWKALSAEERRDLDAAIDAVINDHFANKDYK